MKGEKRLDQIDMELDKLSKDLDLGLLMKKRFEKSLNRFAKKWR
jgi:hypothetical protein